MKLTVKEQFLQNVKVSEEIKKLVLEEIIVDSSSELPTVDYKDGQLLAMGSHAIDVSTGTEYRINSSGVWINQSTGGTTIQITQQPVSAEVEAGESVTFTVAANGTSLTYQWKSSSDGTTYSNISGATSASYTFTTAAGDNGKYYECVITDSNSNTATSNAAILTVTEPAQDPDTEPTSDPDPDDEQNNG